MNFLKVLLSVNKVKNQLNNLMKMLVAIAKRLDQVETDIALLKENAHPPIFTKKQYTSIDERVELLEAFINNLEKIDVYDKELAN